MPDKIIPVALRLWLLFLFTFLLLGYEVVPSIVFGAIGGFAGGTVNAWWQTPGGEPQPSKSQATLIDPLLNWGDRFKSSREIGTRLPFLKLFTRRDKRLSRSRRP